MRFTNKEDLNVSYEEIVCHLFNIFVLFLIRHSAHGKILTVR